MEIAIIGAGGIGSHFCRILSRLLKSGQFGADLKPENFTVFDFDVVEPKNVKWQDYEMTDVGVPKAMLMSLRYGFKWRVARFDEANLSSFHWYLIAADNAKVRRQVFEYCSKVKGHRFVDMRAEGDIFGFFNYNTPVAELLGSLGEDKDSAVGISCQRVSDQERNIIQLGNWFAAIAGMDAMLRLFRGVPCPANMVRPII